MSKVGTVVKGVCFAVISGIVAYLTAQMCEASDL